MDGTKRSWFNQVADTKELQSDIRYQLKLQQPQVQAEINNETPIAAQFINASKYYEKKAEKPKGQMTATWDCFRKITIKISPAKSATSVPTSSMIPGW